MGIWAGYTERDNIHLHKGDRDDRGWLIVERKWVGGGEACISIWQSPDGYWRRVVWDRTEKRGCVFFNRRVQYKDSARTAEARGEVQAFFDSIDDSNRPPCTPNY